MKRLIAVARVGVCLVSLSISILCVARFLGIMPDATGAILDGRKALCESVAVGCSLTVQRGDDDGLGTVVRALVDRNKNVLSAAVRRRQGTVFVAVGDHPRNWAKAPARGSTPTHVRVPIVLGKESWGDVEVCFPPLAGQGRFPVLNHPVSRFIAFYALSGFVVFTVYLQFLFRKMGLGPMGAIPDRVRDTLDSLVEGVLLLDGNQRIALANQAFAQTVGKTTNELEGQSASRLDWAMAESPESRTDFPWNRSLREGSRLTGAVLGFRSATSGTRSLAVNAIPIVADDGTKRGVLATFDDLTTVEKKNVQLRRVLERLKQSREEIRDQNQKLQHLATCDPLTSCLNRRAFFERFEAVWTEAERHKIDMSCLMLDIDHFKSINDRHGHAVGDLALKEVSGVLRSMARTSDVICRYGGEEFCVVLPHVGLDGAVVVAERFRKAIESRTFAGISATASFGVSTFGLGAADPPALLNQADQALYAAKRSGRNRVVRFDQMPKVFDADKPEPEPEPGGGGGGDGVPAPAPMSVQDVPVSYHAVTSLMSALAHRDIGTAEHSRRVADLCLATSKGMMSEHDGYLLEVAALIHDVGKLGVPDSVLQKPGPLTEGEWEVMSTHDRIGVEIITGTFGSPLLSEMVRTHHAWYGGNPREVSLPTGEQIHLGARILAIADAYDAMTSDRVYRKAMTPEAAFAEIRRCSGRQFDPALAEHFIRVMLARGESPDIPIPTLSKHAALKIGLQIETLAEILDSRDSRLLGEIASRLKMTANENNIASIAESAAHIEEAVASRCEWIEALRLSSDLLELCRSTQKSFLRAYQAEPSESDSLNGSNV